MHNREWCWIVALFVLFSAIVTGSDFAKPFGKIQYFDYGYFDHPHLHYNLKNDNNFKYESAKVYVSFPEYDMVPVDKSPYSFDLQPDNQVSQFLFPQQPEGNGWTWARIAFSWDGFRDVRYVPVWVG